MFVNLAADAASAGAAPQLPADAGKAGRVPLRASLAPLGLVTAFAIFVQLSPAAPAHDVPTLFGDHLSRNLLLYVIICGVTVWLFLLSCIVRGRTQERPVTLIASMLRDRWRSDRLLSVAIPPVFLALLLGSFSTFKQRLLPSAGFGMDPFFTEADRMLFLGVDPWRITHAIADSAWATQLIDIAYMLWFIPMMLTALLSWALPAALRVRTLLSFALIWIVVGAVLAYLLPSAGPIYYGTFHSDDPFSDLNAILAAHGAALGGDGEPGLLALRGQAELLEAFRSQELLLAGGISAMPSGHNALATLFALVAFRIKRTLGWIFTAFALVIGFGSVHLGWHYALDGIVAALAAWTIWWAAEWCTQWLVAERPEAEGVTPAMP